MYVFQKLRVKAGQESVGTSTKVLFRPILFFLLSANAIRSAIKAFAEVTFVSLTFGALAVF